MRIVLNLSLHGSRKYSRRSAMVVFQVSCFTIPGTIFKRFFWTCHIYQLLTPERIFHLPMSSNLKTTTTQDACKLKIEEFQKDIESSVQRAFLLRANPGSSGYKKVVVQFMHFASNDIAGIPELEKELGEVFKKVYLYDVKYAKIGASKKHASVSLEVSSLLNDLSKPEAYGSAGNLVILVYSGHGENVKHHGVKQLRVS